MEQTKYATLEPELALASDLAKKAGDAILAMRADAIASSSLKSDESSVTAADLAADAVIRAGLAATGDAIVTEETWKDGDIGKHPRVWFVDPIDGTEDFVKKSRDYVVQIGLCVRGAPVLGVVYQPETGLLWRGVVADRRCERVEADRAPSPAARARRSRASRSASRTRARSLTSSCKSSAACPSGAGRRG